MAGPQQGRAAIGFLENAATQLTPAFCDVEVLLGLDEIVAWHTGT
jgi:hypothetical protein